MTTTNPQPQPQQWVQAPKRRNGFGITAIVLGALAAIMTWIPLAGMFIGWPLSIIAVIMAGLALGFMFARRAGKVISIIGSAFAILGLVLTVTATVITANAVDDAADEAGAMGTATPHQSKHKSKNHDKSGKNDTHKFTDTLKWKNGLTVKINKATTRKASSMMAELEDKVHKGDRVVVFHMTVKNTSDETYDPTMFHVDASYGDKDGTNAPFIPTAGNDGVNDLNKLPSGSSHKATFGAAIPNGNDKHVTMEIDSGDMDLFSEGSKVMDGSIKPLLRN